MAPEPHFFVEVAFAAAEKQMILSVKVAAGTSIETAIERSGILEIFPEINLSSQKIGIYGKLKKLSDVVQAKDRIEIYRPLQIDPKEARKNRSAK